MIYKLTSFLKINFDNGLNDLPPNKLSVTPVLWF